MSVAERVRSPAIVLYHNYAHEGIMHMHHKMGLVEGIDAPRRLYEYVLVNR